MRSREREGGGVRITNIRLSGEDVVISYKFLRINCFVKRLVFDLEEFGRLI